MLHVIDREQLLKAHTADAGNCVQTGQRQSGNAHGHEYGRDIDRNTEHFEEARNAAAEYLERRAGRRGAVCCGSRTGNAQRENCQQAFQHHGAVADLRHILFILDGLGGRTGGNQTVEAGNRAARDRDEQDREHRAELFVGEAGEYRQIHGRMRNDQTDDRTGDHADEHEGRHVVARLLEQPHREDRCEEDVDEGDVAPCRLAEDQRAVCADDKGQDDEHDAENGFLPALEGKLLLDKTEYNGEYHKHDRDHAGCAVGLSRRRQLHDACVAGREGVERTGYHISERRDNDAAEDPREHEEQLAAGPADILLDQHAHRLALVLDRGVQRTKVRDRAEEYTADQHPEQHRQPAKGCGLNCAGYRAGACDRRKLMAEYRPAVGRNEVLSVVQLDGRGLGLGIDAPFVREPASVEYIGAGENNSRDQHDCKCVHGFSSLFRLDLRLSCQ